MTKLVNRAKMTTATTGTGTITLGTAEAGYQSFTDAGVVDADVVRYVIEDGTAFEIGTGTFTASGTTLTRTVSESSNADAALNLSGSAVVYVSATAADIPPVLELYAENPSSPTAPAATGANAVAIGSGAIASDIRAVALGLSRADGDDAVAIGIGATNLTYGARATGALAVGSQASATALQASAVGTNATASGSRSNAFGNETDATNTNSNAFGSFAQSVGTNSTAIARSYASGTDSFAAAIANNTSSRGATGANSVAIGKFARSTSSFSLAIGNGAVASNSRSTSICEEGTSSGSYSVVIGGYQPNDFGINGRFVMGSLFGSIVQSSSFRLKIDTTDATPSVLRTNSSAAGTTNQIILPNNSAYAFHGTIVARQQASQGTACAAFKIEGLIRREGTAASTVLVNSATTVLDNTPGFGMTLSADTVNGGLKIEVTGLAATNIRFVATVHTSEVSF